MATATFSSFVYEEAIKALIASMNERSTGVQKTDQNHFAFNAWKAYIFAALALECIINEFLVSNARFLDRHDQTSVQELIRKLDIRKKYVSVPSLFGVSTFDKSRAPYQGFDCLIELRNDLVHYKMRDHEHIETPPYFGRLKDVNALLVPGGDPGMPWLLNICTFQGALWACNTMNDMRKRFCDLFVNHKSGEAMCRFLRSYPSIPNIAGDYAGLCKEYPATPKK